MRIGDRPGPPEVRIARPAEWLVIGEMLGEAFQDDPLWAWMAPDERRRRLHLGTLFAQVVKPLVGDGSLCPSTFEADEIGAREQIMDREQYASGTHRHTLRTHLTAERVEQDRLTTMPCR